MSLIFGQLINQIISYVMFHYYNVFTANDHVSVSAKKQCSVM